MSLRLAHVRRKGFETKELQLDNGIPYLVWSKFPKARKLNPEDSIGVRVWPAGAGPSEKWIVTEYFEPGTKGWGDGGYELSNPRGEKTQVFLDEVIIHPQHKAGK
jgi:hypothetical protein